jgi:hypothetical protein
LCLRIRGRIEAIILLSKKNCGIPYSFLPSLFRETGSARRKSGSEKPPIRISETVERVKGII